MEEQYLGKGEDKKHKITFEVFFLQEAVKTL